MFYTPLPSKEGRRIIQNPRWKAVYATAKEHVQLSKTSDKSHVWNPPLTPSLAVFNHIFVFYIIVCVPTIVKQSKHCRKCYTHNAAPFLLLGFGNSQIQNILLLWLEIQPGQGICA